MTIIKRINLILGKIEGYIIAYSVIFMAVLLLANVAGRLIFNNSITFTEEICKALLIMMTFIGVSYTIRHNTQVEMTAIIDRLSPKALKVLRIIIQIITAIILIAVSYVCVKYLDSVRLLGRITPALQIPAWITLIPLPLGLCLGGVQCAIAALLNITDKNNLYLGSEAIAGERTESTFTLMDVAEMGDEKW